ncbi:MAG: hypothetical protein WD895_09480 [Acidimicrobiia bacterium]
MSTGDLARAATLGAGIGLDRLVSHTYAMVATEAAFRTLVERRGLKVVVHPNTW